MRDFNGACHLSVAVIDDDPATRRMFRAWFEGDGCSVVECASGAEGIERAASHDVDALCLDLGMADIQGLEVLSRVRANDPDLPVVIVTARREHEVVVEAMRRGANDFLCKPLDPSRVVQAVRRAVDARVRVDAFRQARVESGLEAFRTGAGLEVVLPLREVQRRAIAHALRVTGRSVPHAARMLGIGRSTLYRRMGESADGDPSLVSGDEEGPVEAGESLQ